MATKAQLKYWKSLKGKKPKNITGLLLGRGWNKNIKIKTNTGKTHFKKGISPWNKGKKNLEMSGEKHWNWQGGKPKHPDKEIRKSLEYRLWRESVFKRDNWTCIFCGIIGGKIHADHIKPFSLFPELRFAIDNGRTLCISCHKKTDTYGSKSIRK